MGEGLEHAREGLEHAHHAHEDGFTSATTVAILISALAACLAIADMGEKRAQNEYLTHHITFSDEYAFYQAKTIRSTIENTTMQVLSSLPNAGDQAVRERIESAKKEMGRLDDDEKSDGRKQLLEKAKKLGEERDHALHRYHNFEVVVGALQIAIVLASVSVVVRKKLMAAAAAVIGGVAILYGLGVHFDMI